MSTEKHETHDKKLVSFKTSVSWCGDRFNHAPGDVVQLEESVAKAREAGGVGTIVKDDPKAK